MLSSRKEGKASSRKNEEGVLQYAEKNLRKAQTVHGGNIVKTYDYYNEDRTREKKNKQTNKPNEQVQPYDPMHKCLTDSTRRLKKRKKKFYSPLPEGVSIPDYTPESSYDYDTSSASDGYSPNSDREDAESRAQFKLM